MNGLIEFARTLGPARLAAMAAMTAALIGFFVLVIVRVPTPAMAIVAALFSRMVGEAIDIFVNNRLVARGEVVLVEDRLGVTMTEIIKAERN